LSGCIPSNYVSFCARNAVIRLEQNPLLPVNGDFDAFCLNNIGGDFDADGYCGGSTDCDDNNAATYPGAPEICDGKDNDCDASIDEGIPDVTNTWIGTNGNWNVATNWSTGKIPEKCHNVVISPTSIYTVTIPNGYTAKASSLTIGTNGRLLVQFNAIINVVDKGEVSNSGNMTCFGTINISNPLNTLGVALTNSGILSINSSSTVNITNAGATAIRNNVGATFDNNGVLNITNNHVTNGQFGIDNRGAMTNTGQMTISNINGKEIRLAVGSMLQNTDLGTIEAK
jgi:Putative metal-binding motif